MAGRGRSEPPRRGAEGGADAEARRLEEDARREKNWKRWGPYLAERQWGTVREDYSPDGSVWDYFTHDHARSRAYRWGEDGLLGITDRECRLCFALALWNGRDPILKERLFGLSGPQGNHGEDVKECYFYLDSTPTHSYLKGLYKYPQAEFPYARLVEENRRRGAKDPEFELLDTGVFDGDRYFDVLVEYAKSSPDDVLIRITASNRGPQAATLHLLPTLWFRNTWSWGRTGESYWPKPSLKAAAPGLIAARHSTLGSLLLAAEGTRGGAPALLFAENESNTARLYGAAPVTLYPKDAFHDHLVAQRDGAVNPRREGTKAAVHYRLEIPAGGEVSVRLRLSAEPERRSDPFSSEFEETFERRLKEADDHFGKLLPAELTAEERTVARQAYSGLLWTKQYYHYVVREWLEGDPAQPPPSPQRLTGRNSDWAHLYNRDIISMPDKWEYPWYAAWDTAFHMIPLARLDPGFAKEQLVLFLREWYMHPKGKIPSYEFALDDVNPPVHAWSAWRVYKMTGLRGKRDRLFLSRVFQKHIINFTWWVNRKDIEGKHLFSGGFLGLDNIGVFDRSKPLPTGGRLEQADGTAWMAFYCATMLSMALELAREDPAYEDLASKFFEHFVAIADAMNSLGGTGLWDDADGFYYDKLLLEGEHRSLRVRSMVGLIPLLAVEILEDEVIERLPGFRKRLYWFLENRKDLANAISYLDCADGTHPHRLLAIPSRPRLERVLRYLFDESEFLSPYGIRSLSRVHLEHPYVFQGAGGEWSVRYAPGDSDTGLFGGNSNWRGPIWFPLNYLLIEALERYHHFYEETLQVECPTGSGRRMNLREAAQEVSGRLARLFLPGPGGRRPLNGEEKRFAEDPHWRDLVLFYECFHGDTGRGVGASHQTGWTALVVRSLEDQARLRARNGRSGGR
jgi:hypothetical protein